MPSNLKAVDETLPQSTAGYVPHSTEAEQTLLGALMLNNKLYEEIEGYIKPEHFYLPIHASIYTTIENLFYKGFEASPITVKETLKDKSSLDKEYDLLEHLIILVENASLTANIKTVAGIIYNYYLQRELLEVSVNLTESIPESTSLELTSEVIENVEAKLYNLAETGKNKDAAEIKDALRTVIEKAEEARKNKSDLLGVTSGLNALDKTLGGFQKSDLIIIAARPSMGKTALAINFAHNAADALYKGREGGAGVGIFSLEMSADQLAARMLSSASHIASTLLQQGKIGDDEFGRVVHAANEMSDYKLYIDDTPMLSINQLRTRARRLSRKHGIGMLVVDYLQLLSGNGKSDNRVQEISMISQGLKSIARELNIPVIALSQLSRGVESRENKRPMLSDLRESGSIEQDADIVMFIYREEYYIEKQIGTDSTDVKNIELQDRLNKIKGVAEILISKNRKGATGKVLAHFTPETTTFNDYSGLDSYPDGIDG